MFSGIKGMLVTLSTFIRPVVTYQYPKEHKPIEPRFMGFPALTWDYSASEPYCTGCMVCIRNCPTQCMSAEMLDNSKAESGESHRRKIVGTFEINLNRCIICGICVEVCNLDAIVMSHEHEISSYQRNGDRVDVSSLIDMGKSHQEKEGWQPAAPERNHTETVLATRRAKASAAGESVENGGKSADADSRSDQTSPNQDNSTEKG